jgi:hypothetical protein
LYRPRTRNNQRRIGKWPKNKFALIEIPGYEDKREKEIEFEAIYS